MHPCLLVEKIEKQQDPVAFANLQDLADQTIKGAAIDGDRLTGFEWDFAASGSRLRPLAAFKLSTKPAGSSEGVSPWQTTDRTPKVPSRGRQRWR